MVIGIVVGVFIFIALVCAIGVAASRNRTRRGDARVRGPAQTTARLAGSKEVRYEELGGKTMAEYCRENEKDNAALESRRQRRSQHDSGEHTAR